MTKVPCKSTCAVARLTNDARVTFAFVTAVSGDACDCGSVRDAACLQVHGSTEVQSCAVATTTQRHVDAVRNVHNEATPRDGDDDAREHVDADMHMTATVHTAASVAVATFTRRTVVVKVVDPCVRYADVCVLSCQRDARMQHVYRALAARLRTRYSAFVCYTQLDNNSCGNDDDRGGGATTSCTARATTFVAPVDVHRVLLFTDTIPQYVVCQILPAASRGLSRRCVQQWRRWIMVDVLTTSTQAKLSRGCVPLVVPVPTLCSRRDVVNAMTRVCGLSRYLRDYLCSSACSIFVAHAQSTHKVCLARVCDEVVDGAHVAFTVPLLMVGDVVYVDVAPADSVVAATITGCAHANVQGIVTRCGEDAGVVVYDVRETHTARIWQRLSALRVALLQ